MNNKSIKNLSNPVDNNDGANKTYVDNRIITNSNLTNYSISLNKLIGMDGNGDLFLKNNGTTASINDTNFANNSFNGSKI
jgi:hypothetical protein